MQFRGYAFCRAHSTAYGVEAYEAAQLKCYWPGEFLAAVLTHGKGFYSRLFYTIEARRLGLGFTGPRVNGAVREFVTDKFRMIRVPVAQVKGVGEDLLGRIEAGQPFASLQDFHQRVGPGADEMLSLLRVGAFDGFVASRTEQFWELRAMGLCPVGPELGLTRAPCPAPAVRTEPGRLDCLRDEMELLGFPVGGHPVELFPDVAWESYVPLAAVRDFAGSRVTVCGLVVAQRLHRQKDGRVMKFVSICDRTDILECEIFAAAYRAGGGVLARSPVVGLTGVVEPLGPGAGCVLRVSRVQSARTVTRPDARPPASRTTGTSARPGG